MRGRRGSGVSLRLKTAGGYSSSEIKVKGVFGSAPLSPKQAEVGDLRRPIVRCRPSVRKRSLPKI